MHNSPIIKHTMTFVKQCLAQAEGGHDWWHVQRVWQLARHIGKSEEVNMLVVELGALLHDIADAKFHNGDEALGPQLARDFLTSQRVDSATIDHVCAIIAHVSFKGGNQQQEFHSPELAVVQDADRLDAMGAIGIARAFNYGGHAGRALHDPGIPPKLNMTKQQYRQSTAPTINHFYEKLLRLKERMNTVTGRSLAEHRHAVMGQFLDEFFAEWNGTR